MRDLEIAKKRLNEGALTLCIVKEGAVVFESGSSGISGLLEAVEKFGGRLEGASVGDRVAGRAVALLCVYGNIKAIFAVTLSKRGKSTLEEYAIHHEWTQLVESILDMDREDMCPFEELATEISDPAEAYVRLKRLQRSLSTH